MTCHHCWHQDGEPPRHVVLCCKCEARIVRVPAQQAAQRVVRTPDAPTPSRPPAGPVAGVQEMLNALRVCTNPVDKRKLRARLRAAGHTGGLRHG